MYILKISAKRTVKIKNHSIKYRNEKCIELLSDKYKESGCKNIQKYFRPLTVLLLFSYIICTVMKTRITTWCTARRNTEILNIEVKVKIMRCQSATVITDVNFENTNSSITDIFLPGLKRALNFFV